MALGFIHSMIEWFKFVRREPALSSAIAERFFETLTVDGSRGAKQASRIPVRFGSYSGTLALRSVDQEAINVYRHSHCFLLAQAFHELYGYQLVVFTDEERQCESWRGHVAVKLSDGRYLDIAGVYETAEELLTGFKFRSEERSVTPEELIEIVVYNEDPKLPVFTYVDELERLITYDFARYLIETYGLDKKH